MPMTHEERMQEQAIKELGQLRDEGRFDTTTLCWVYLEQSAYRRGILKIVQEE